MHHQLVLEEFASEALLVLTGLLVRGTLDDQLVLGELRLDVADDGAVDVHEHDERRRRTTCVTPRVTLIVVVTLVTLVTPDSSKSRMSTVIIVVVNSSSSSSSSSGTGTRNGSADDVCVHQRGRLVQMGAQHGSR